MTALNNKVLSKGKSPNAIPLFQIRYIFKNDVKYISTKLFISAKLRIYIFDILSNKKITITRNKYINILILIMIINYNNYKSFFLIMILGGSLGNLFDRVYFKAVPDFIDIHHGDFHWFVFNVADIFITVGVLCLILSELLINKDIKNENK